MIHDAWKLKKKKYNWVRIELVNLDWTGPLTFKLSGTKTFLRQTKYTWHNIKLGNFQDIVRIHAHGMNPSE